MNSFSQDNESIITKTVNGNNYYIKHTKESQTFEIYREVLKDKFNGNFISADKMSLSMKHNVQEPIKALLSEKKKAYLNSQKTFIRMELKVNTKFKILGIYFSVPKDIFSTKDCDDTKITLKDLVKIEKLMEKETINGIMYDNSLYNTSVNGFGLLFVPIRFME